MKRKRSCENLETVKIQKVNFSSSQYMNLLKNNFLNLNEIYLNFYEKDDELYQKLSKEKWKEIVEWLHDFVEIFKKESIQALSSLCADYFVLMDPSLELKKELENLWKICLKNVNEENFEEYISFPLSVGIYPQISEPFELLYISKLLKTFKNQKRKDFELFKEIKRNLDTIEDENVRKNFEIELNSSFDKKDVEFYLKLLSSNQQLDDIYLIIMHLDISFSIPYLKLFQEKNSKELKSKCTFEMKKILINFYYLVEEKSNIEEFQKEFEEWKSEKFLIDDESFKEIPYLEILSNGFLFDVDELELFNQYMLTEGFLNYKNYTLGNPLDDENIFQILFNDHKELEREIEIFVDLFVLLRTLENENFETKIKEIQEEVLEIIQKDEKLYLGNICGYLKNLSDLDDCLIIEKSFIENLCPIFEALCDSKLFEIDIFSL
jgi:hypothetical protein